MKNNKIIKSCFWILLIYSVFTILIIFFKYPYFYQIKNVFYSLNNIDVNLTLDKKISEKPLVCFDDYCSDLASYNNTTVYNVEFSGYENGLDFYLKPVKKYFIVYPYDKKDEFLSAFSDLYLYNGDKKYYFTKNDLLKFKTSIAQIKFDYSQDSHSTKYYRIELEGVESNYNGVFNHFIIFVLSLFFNCKYFIFPYLGLLGCFLIYSFYRKDKNNCKKENCNSSRHYFLFSLILFLGVVLRFYNIENLPLYPDEIYTKTVAISSFQNCFKDPGNPPLFYLIEFLFCKLFNDSNFSLRFLSFLSGVGFVLAVYLFFKRINKNLALLMMFFASFNTINIIYSQSARCYSLCMVMCVLISYFFLKYLKNLNKKDLIIFSFLSVIAINLHYFCVVYVFSNFVYGIFVIFKNKNHKELLKFVFVNLICFLSFVPYLLISFKNSINQDFNSWIEPLSLIKLKSIISSYFINEKIFLIFLFIVFVNLILIFINKFKINKIKKEVFLYLIFSIVFSLFIILIISIFVKPVLDKRILLSLYGLFILLQGVMISGVFECNLLNNKNYFFKNLYSILLLFLFFSITQAGEFKITHNLNGYFFFIQNDIKNNDYNKNIYEIHGIVIQDINFLKNFPEIEKLSDINWHVIDTLTKDKIEKISKKDLTKSNKKVILYLSNYGTSLDSNYFIEKQIKIYKTGANKSAKVVLE